MNKPGSVFTEEDLKAITAEIAGIERKSSGEVRVLVRHRRHWNEYRTHPLLRFLTPAALRSETDRIPVHEIALREFRRLGMDRTAERTGVLILLLLSERLFHIVADEGIHRKVPGGTWDKIALAMSERFAGGNFRDGILEGIRRAGEVLAENFPRRAGDRNELPDDVVEE